VNIKLFDYVVLVSYLIYYFFLLSFEKKQCWIVGSVEPSRLRAMVVGQQTWSYFRKLAFPVVWHAILHL